MDGAAKIAEWIAVDWGTSSLRVWIIGTDGQPFATEASGQGVGTLQNGDFEAALLDLIEPYLIADTALPVICCGVVGSRQGWSDAAYLSVPCAAPNGKTATRVACNDPRISVSILPGIKQITPPDVMCGEETQIAGFLQGNPDFAGVICLPGTHTKWVHISANEIVSFQTFMTGELFALLSKQSVLRHSVGNDGFDPSKFETAVAEAIDRPQVLASKLFGLHAGALVADLDPVTARSRLSGLLIGVELAGARPYWLGQNVAIIADSAMAEPYRLGLAAQGVDAEIFDVASLTLNGLKAAYGSLKECSV